MTNAVKSVSIVFLLFFRLRRAKARSFRLVESKRRKLSRREEVIYRLVKAAQDAAAPCLAFNQK